MCPCTLIMARGLGPRPESPSTPSPATLRAVPCPHGSHGHGDARLLGRYPGSGEGTTGECARGAASSPLAADWGRVVAVVRGRDPGWADTGRGRPGATGTARTGGTGAAGAQAPTGRTVSSGATGGREMGLPRRGGCQGASKAGPAAGVAGPAVAPPAAPWSLRPPRSLRYPGPGDTPAPAPSPAPLCTPTLVPAPAPAAAPLPTPGAPPTLPNSLPRSALGAAGTPSSLLPPTAT